ncbi:MAG: HK97 gp10 family phage protein [Phycicoccus sp.]
MATRVQLVSAGMAEMLNSAGVAAAMMSRAQRVRDVAQGLAPVDTGTYRQSIVAYAARTDRAVARVTATVYYAPAVEADHGVLQRALDAAGGS